MTDYAKGIDKIIIKWTDDAIMNGRRSDIEFAIGQAIKESLLLFGVMDKK